MIPRNWLNFWCVLVVGSLSQAITLPVRASEPICDPEAPKKCAMPLKAGELAPFDGQLLSTPLAIDLGLKADFCDDRLKLELNFQKKTLDLELESERRLRELDRKAAKQKEDLLMERLEEAQGVNWYEHPAFVATVSVVCTVLAIWGARETLKAW